MKPYRIRQLAATSSTNDDAKHAAETGEAEGLVVQALTQTAGRGRHGRQWQSPEGNIYCSVLLRPADRKSYGLYGFAASLAVRDTVKCFLPDAAVALKWPNDVLAGGRKISGILLEAGEDYLIAGIGLNVRHHPENALYPATSLHACGAEKAEVAAAFEILLDRLWHWHEIMKAEGFAPVRAAWLENARTGHMTVKLPDGVVEGVFETVDAEGCLRLRLADGTERAIATGDVFFGE